MKSQIRIIALIGLVALCASLTFAQTRPRRARSTPTNSNETAAKKPDDSLLDVVPTDKDGQPASTTRSRTAPASNSSTNRTAPPANDRPILTPKPNPSTVNTPNVANNAAPAPTPAAGPDIKSAIALFNQKKYVEALKEAKAIIAADAKISDAWKLAGLSELNLKKYPDAVSDLEKARELQAAEGAPNKETDDALAEAYARAEQYDKALPLLTTATTRAGATADPLLLQLRGVSEIKTGKTDAAAQTFAAASKANPKDTVSLFYLGKIAFDKKDFSGAIANFNRVTTATPADGAAWKYLTYAYLQRGAAAGDPAKSEPDYLGAARASEGLIKVDQSEDAQVLRGQTLYYAKQYPQAILALEKVSNSPNTKGEILLVLGMAYLQTKNNPKMIAALEKAAVKSPNNVNVFRYLGYGYTVEKQYPKALAAYEKAQKLAPDDASIKEAIDQLKPVVTK
jgi:tetratricopeptide (TPR) repeat protein